jgi:hypothetical protein
MYVFARRNDEAILNIEKNTVYPNKFASSFLLAKTRVLEIFSWEKVNRDNVKNCQNILCVAL